MRAAPPASAVAVDTAWHAYGVAVAAREAAVAARAWSHPWAYRNDATRARRALAVAIERADEAAAAALAAYTAILAAHPEHGPGEVSP